MKISKYLLTFPLLVYIFGPRCYDYVILSDFPSLKCAFSAIALILKSISVYTLMLTKVSIKKDEIMLGGSSLPENVICMIVPLL